MRNGAGPEAVRAEWRQQALYVWGFFLTNLCYNGTEDSGRFEGDLPGEEMICPQRTFYTLPWLRWLVMGATVLCATGPRFVPVVAWETTATVAASAPAVIYPSEAARHLPRHEAPAGPREPDFMLPQDGVGILTSDYFLQAVMSLSWKDEQGTILCSGTYEERAVPPSSPADDDRTITVRIQERWDDVPCGP